MSNILFLISNSLSFIARVYPFDMSEFKHNYTRSERTAFQTKRHRYLFGRRERETVHEVRGTSVLHGPKPTLCGLRPRTFEARMCLDCMKKGHPPDVLFHATESARRDSNPRPRPWQGRAPPTEPLAHFPGLFTRQVILYSTPRDMSILFFKKNKKLTLIALIV